MKKFKNLMVIATCGALLVSGIAGCSTNKTEEFKETEDIR